MQYNTHYTEFLGVPLSAHLLCSNYIVTEPVQQSSLIACYHRIMPNIKCDHFLALFPIHSEQLFPLLLRMLKPDNQPSTLENIRVLDGMLWLQVDGLNNQLRSLLKYLPTPRASCFSTQGIQIDDPNNALSYFSILIHVISSMHITHLYLHFEVILKMKYAHIGKLSHQDQYNI